MFDLWLTLEGIGISTRVYRIMELRLVLLVNIQNPLCNPSNANSKPGRDCFYLHLNPDGTEHVFAHSVESFMRESKTRREAAEARRSARHLRELNATLSAFAESLILNAPEVFDEDGNLVDVWGDEDEEDEGDEDEGSDGEWEDWEDRADDMGSGHLWDLY